jgi:hypothetical protein
VTEPSEDAVAFERLLGASTPGAAGVARALRLTVLERTPGAVPHRAHVNLQLADGVDLPDPEGRIEGTGKRVRHVKVRSVEDAGSAWLRAVVAAQVAHRGPRAE